MIKIEWILIFLNPAPEKTTREMDMSTLTKDFRFTEQELSDFKERGYAGPFTLYEEEEMNEYWRKLRPKLLNRKYSIYNTGQGAPELSSISNYDRHLDIEFLANHISQPGIIDRISGILGDDILCWRSEFFPKYPGDEGTDWHQANNFGAVAGDRKPQIEWTEGKRFQGALTVWTAFTESTIENGCLQFIPGTHNTMYYDESKKLDYDEAIFNQKEKDGKKRGFFGYDYRQLQIDPNWRPDESKAVSAVMRPGQFIIFWSTLMHASHPHTGKEDMRMGYTVRYLPTSAKIFPYSKSLEEYGGKGSLENYGAVLVSGRDTYKHNKIRTETTRGFPFITR